MSEFKFKKFDIRQTNSAMKVGTDGVLLGAWAYATQPNRILDIGTGTGLVAMMLAQRFPNARVDAVETDDSAIIDAKYNFTNSSFSSRLFAHHLRIQNFEPKIKYDLIVSNPPYFERSLKPEKEGRIAARHDALLSFKELIDVVSRLLAPTGNCDFIIPTNRQEELITLAKKHKLYLSRKTTVRGQNELPVKRVLLSFTREDSPLSSTELVIEKRRHEYTEAYVNLTKDFYLKM